MKNLICVAALVVAGGQGFADDGQLSRTDLNAFGLSGMQIIGDAEGMQVRGSGSAVSVRGSSWSFLDVVIDSLLYEGTTTITGDGYTETRNFYDAEASNNLESSAEGASNSLSSFYTRRWGQTYSEGVQNIRFTWNYNQQRDLGSVGGAYATAR